MIPYSQPTVTEEDILAVHKVLRSGWLTTGPMVERFEKEFADYVRSKHAIAVSSGTAALHLACLALGIGNGDIVQVPTLTFCATANAVKYCGAEPMFVDVDADALLSSINGRGIAVDYAGMPAEGSAIIHDSCHALGTKPLGKITCYSLHAVKHLTTGEGGMIVTDNDDLAIKMRSTRNHGRNEHGDMVRLGFNYRLSDIGCALGLSQLKRMDTNIKRRRETAARYFEELKDLPVKLPADHPNHVWHLFVLQVDNRDEFRAKLAVKGIGTQVHYQPVHTLTYYNRGLQLPVAEKVAKRIVSIPMHHGLTDEQVEQVITAIKESCQ